VDGQDLLFEVVGRLQSGRGFTDLLDGGEQQSDQDTDDRDDDEEFH
jgi:hypothetical protein